MKREIIKSVKDAGNNLIAEEAVNLIILFDHIIYDLSSLAHADDFFLQYGKSYVAASIMTSAFELLIDGFA